VFDNILGSKTFKMLFKNILGLAVLAAGQLAIAAANTASSNNPF
jgi:hypothetical protein